MFLNIGYRDVLFAFITVNCDVGIWSIVRLVFIDFLANFIVSLDDQGGEHNPTTLP